MVKTLSGNAPLYESQVNTKLSVPSVKQGTGPISLVESISRDAGAMATKLQDTAEKLYLTNFELASRKAINEIYLKNKADPEALARDFSAAYDGLTKDASPLMQSQLKARFELMTAPHISHATELRTKINTDMLKEQSLTALAQAQNDLEHNAAQMLSDNSQVAFDASRAAQLSMNTMEKMLSQTDENGVPLFSAEQRVRLREEARQGVMKQGLKHWFDEQPDKIAALEAIKNGNKKFNFFDAEGNRVNEIDPFKEMDLQTFDRLTDHMKSEIKSQVKEIKAQQGISRVQQALNGTAMLDPKSKTDKKDVESHFQTHIEPQLANMDDTQKANAIAQYVERIGMIPESVASHIRATSRNGSIQEQAFTADLVNRITEGEKRLAIGDMPDTDTSYCVLVGESMRYGLTAEEAIEKAKVVFDPSQKDIIDKRRRDLMKFKLNEEANIKELLNEGWFGKPGLPDMKDISDKTKEAYYNLYQQEYLLTGNHAVAKKMAGEFFKRTYGVTRVTGSPRVMKYAPENYYSINGVPDNWMREQLESDVKSIDGYQDVQGKDILLTPDTTTAREAIPGGSPSYLVYTKNKNGEYVPIRDKNSKLLRYKFDSGVVIDGINKNVAERKGKKINDAIAKRSLSDVLSLAAAVESTRY